MIKNIVTDFGAIADGVTDNYNAFVAAAAYASTHKNTTINFPVGTFYIHKYRTIKNDPITHIFWKNCIGLKLLGTKGTIISMNGKFFRPLDYTVGTAKKSYTTGLCPFHLQNCDGVEIRDIEVNGNVQDTKRLAGVDDANPSVTESDNKLLRITKCSNVTVENVHLHHAECDGIMISGDRVDGDWVNSTNLIFINVWSHNNGRNGMSIGGLNDGYFKNCKFDSSGITEGTYGRNDPSAGVDIEPGEFHNNDNIIFEDGSSENNFGSHFICSAPDKTSGVSLIRFAITTGIETSKPQAITILAAGTIIQSCVFKLGSRSMKFTNINKSGSTTLIKDCTIEGSDNILLANSHNMEDSLIFENNQFKYTKNVMTKTFFTLQMNNLKFLDNKIYISSAALKSRPKGFHAAVQNAIVSSGNKFYSETSAKPRVNYTGTILVEDL